MATTLTEKCRKALRVVTTAYDDEIDFYIDSSTTALGKQKRPLGAAKARTSTAAGDALAATFTSVAR